MAGLAETAPLDLCGGRSDGVPLLERGGFIVIPGLNGVPAFWWNDDKAAFEEVASLAVGSRVFLQNAASRAKQDPFGLKRPRLIYNEN